jgi:hypothetical protein
VSAASVFLSQSTLRGLLSRTMSLPANMPPVQAPASSTGPSRNMSSPSALRKQVSVDLSGSSSSDSFFFMTAPTKPPKPVPEPVQAPTVLATAEARLTASTFTVARWLHSLQLDSFAALLAAAGVDDLPSCRSLDDFQLTMIGVADSTVRETLARAATLLRDLDDDDDDDDDKDVYSTPA